MATLESLDLRHPPAIPGVAKLDIDANPSTPGKYGIRGIPTVILYKDGQPHAQSVGAMSKSKLTQFLDSNL